MLRTKPERMYRWLHQGSYVQITAQSILGRFGSAAQHRAEQWLDEDRVHFVASDAHNPATRPSVAASAPRLTLLPNAAAKKWPTRCFATILSPCLKAAACPTNPKPPTPAPSNSASANDFCFGRSRTGVQPVGFFRAGGIAVVESKPTR